MDIYVGSLPFKLKEGELSEIFEKFGEVASAKIIIDKITRQSKGFGFVEMPDDNQAKEAISNLNGFEVMGRALVVNESQKTEKGPAGRSGGGGGFKSGGGGFPRRDDAGRSSSNRSGDRPGDKKWGDRSGRDQKGGFNRRDRNDFE